MRNRKTLSLIIIIFAFILLVFLLYLTFFTSEKKTVLPDQETEQSSGQLPPSESLPDPSVNPGDKPRDYQQFDISQEEPHQTNQNDLAKIARSIAELYGSFSNHSNYSNYADLKVIMTEEMKLWADKQVASLRSSGNSSGDYYGISTKAISSQILDFNDQAGLAKILVNTQRSESTTYINENEDQAYNQAIEIDFKKVNGRWLVDSAYWKDR